jgi:hypothetical protein
MPTSRHSLTQFSSLVSLPKYRSNSLAMFLIFLPVGRDGDVGETLTAPKARFAMLFSREAVEPPFARGCVEAFLDFFFAIMNLSSGKYTDFSCLMSCEGPGRNKERRKEREEWKEVPWKTYKRKQKRTMQVPMNPCLSIICQSYPPFQPFRVHKIEKPSPLDHAGTRFPT